MGNAIGSMRNAFVVVPSEPDDAPAQQNEQGIGSGNLYFGAHYFLGQGRSMWDLDGDNGLLLGFGRGDGGVLPIMTGATIGNQPRVPPAQTKQATSVRSLVNLHKDSLALIRDESDPNLYKVAFKFDSLEPCTIQIHFVASEHVEPPESTVVYHPSRKVELPPLKFPRGIGQDYRQPLEHALNVAQYQEQELVHQPESSVYPVVITIEAGFQHGAAAGLDKTKFIKTQITLATLAKTADGYTIKPIKQKIQIGGNAYVVHDLYGIEQNAVKEGVRECVVCMTEACDSVVLPCRHMCLCSGCADMLRYQSNKCPICRTGVKSLLKIKVNKAQDDSITVNTEPKATTTIQINDDEDDEPPLVRNDKKKRADAITVV